MVGFKAVIFLKKDPWFISCLSEEDAIQTCDNYKGIISGVACSDSNIVIKQPKQTIVLQSPNVPLKIEAPVSIDESDLIEVQQDLLEYIEEKSE